MYNYDEQNDVDFVDLNLHSYSKETKANNIIDNQLELFLQEIELAVKIGPGEIWGIYENININRYVFNQYITLNQVTNEIKTYIENNCSQAANFSWDIKAQFINYENKNMLYITLTINRDNDNKDYKVDFLLGS